MTAKRKRKNRKNRKNSQQPQTSFSFAEREEEPIKKKIRDRPLLLIFLALSFPLLIIILIFTYELYLKDIIEDVNWLLPQIVTNFILFLFLLLITGGSSIGLFIKEERKKVSTYIIALIGLIFLAVSIYPFTAGLNGILDMERFLDGDYEIAEGVIEDYSLIYPKYGNKYVDTITIDDIEYDVTSYLSVREAEEGVGKQRLKLHYLPHSKIAVIAEFYNDEGVVTKVMNKRAPKSLK